ncbi:hypothetical protein, variant [Puccinia striiformis f. sp. tritici PST-78]|uniref:Uncharacterized protein n=1 Tax=Puccinia striiformis f. sp. tritici PST-78 TaxID=1165861 RepID=A0A0L0VVQ2_9BASI|nr:hypothetical protein PSTG_03657 [Puccinia striiformis f. sp. tritici PST-78]KNF03066.1 hypothetical protein, variant [Puccinia striiformis f. sp. tritici PST-78]
MLLTKILVAFQISHYYVILGHPLALSKPLVKRAEKTLPRTVGTFRGVEEDTGPLRSESAKQGSKSIETVSSVKPSSSLPVLRQGSSERRTVYDTQINPQKVLRNKISFQYSVIKHLDTSQREMLQRIVNNSVQNNQPGNAILNLNTLWAILNDFQKKQVFSFFEKNYPTLAKPSAFQHEKSHGTIMHSVIHQLIDKMPTRHPAYPMKGTIHAECQALMAKLDTTAKKEQLANILIDDYSQLPTYTAQFLQDYYVKIGNFLSILSKSEKKIFRKFREDLIPFAAVGLFNLMNEHKLSRYGKVILEGASDSEKQTFSSVSDKMEYILATEEKFQRSIDEETLVVLSNLERHEIDNYFKMAAYLMQESYKPKKINQRNHKTVNLDNNWHSLLQCFSIRNKASRKKGKK